MSFDFLQNYQRKPMMTLCPQNNITIKKNNTIPPPKSLRWKNRIQEICLGHPHFSEWWRAGQVQVTKWKALFSITPKATAHIRHQETQESQAQNATAWKDCVYKANIWPTLEMTICRQYDQRYPTHNNIFLPKCVHFMLINTSHHQP